jgi:hypothetical protein
VAAVAMTYHELFQPELRVAPRIATLTERGPDILVGRWTVPSDQGRFSELIVWETPQGTSFIFRFPRRSWSGDSAIRSAFQRLLLPARPDGKTPPAKGVTVNITRPVHTAMDRGRRRYLTISTDGQLLYTDGMTVGRLDLQRWEQLGPRQTDMVVPIPFHLSSLPSGALVLDAPPNPAIKFQSH